MGFDWTFGLGSLLGSGVSSAAQAAMAQKQMDFQERMRATQYQTTMADMRKAGLNPILAAKLGGAGTPPGAMAQIGDLGAAAGQGISSALAVKKQRAEVDNIKTDTELKKSQEFVNNAQTWLNNMNAQRAEWEANSAKIANKYLRWEEPGRKIEYDIDTGTGGTISRWLKRFGVTPQRFIPLPKR